MAPLDRRKAGAKITRLSKIADCRSEAKLKGFVAQCGDTLTQEEREAVARHKVGLALIKERRGW